MCVRGSWRPNKDCNILTPLLWPSELCLSRSPYAQPGGRGPTLLAFSTASYHQLVWSPNSIGSLEDPLGRVWLSLPHLVSITSDLQLSDFVSWPSSTPTQSSTQSLDDMFNRHQAEITVMQFRGHSLPVHQSMSVSWDFYLVSFRQPISAYAISFDYWPLGCVNSFQCITLEWHVWPGRRSKYNTGSNTNERIHHTPQCPRKWSSITDTALRHM